MYYCHSCSYCSRVFCTYSTRKEDASTKLYYGIKQHLKDYDEDHKEYQFDDGVKTDSNEVYANMTEYSSRPSGAYEV